MRKNEAKRVDGNEKQYSTSSYSMDNFKWREPWVTLGRKLREYRSRKTPNFDQTMGTYIRRKFTQVGSSRIRMADVYKRITMAQFYTTQKNLVDGLRKSLP